MVGPLMPAYSDLAVVVVVMGYDGFAIYVRVYTYLQLSTVRSSRQSWTAAAAVELVLRLSARHTGSIARTASGLACHLWPPSLLLLLPPP